MQLDSDCPPFLKPRLRLFLSADIVGSTALKQSQVIDLSSDSKIPKAPWFYIVQGFYIEAKIAFLDEWRKGCANKAGEDFPSGDDPLLWKTIGDEILFSKVLTDYRQLTLTIKCWVHALRRIRTFLKSRDKRLDVKSTAWIAGFPVKNKDVVLSNSTELLDYKEENYLVTSGNLLNKYYNNPLTDEVTVDFVGPSVDVGFRLAAYATARRFVVSVGIPYIVSLTTPASDGEENEINFHFGGTASLKGVFGGTPYPLFWIDMAEAGTVASLEDPFTKEAHCHPSDIRKYCNAFYAEQDNYTFKPFIHEKDEHKLKQLPPWYELQLNRLIEEFNRPSTTIDMGIEPELPTDRQQSGGSKKPARYKATHSEDMQKRFDDLMAKLVVSIKDIDK